MERLLALLLCAAPSAAYAQNHVVVRDFDWKVASTEHFDIHYYEGSAALLPAAARVLETSYARLAKQLGAEFDRRRPFFLYASVNDMQQSGIVDVGDGTGGVTEPFKDRFMAYNDGSLRWLDTVLTHELVHVFQFRVLVSGWWKSARILKTIVYPLWMMEGMAEYFSHAQSPTEGHVVVRDAATSGGLIPLWKLEHFSHLKPHQIRLAYETGGAALEFLEAEFGGGKVAQLLKTFESRFESNAALHEIIGSDLFAFDRRWREYASERYGREARRLGLKEPAEYGAALTQSSDDIPVFNASPVFTPDGRSMAFLSTRDGHPPSLMLKDLGTGRLRRLLGIDTRVENVELGRFADVSRVLSISPDGRRLAFMAQKNHREHVCLYDLETGRLRRIPLPSLQAALAPAFSPDGRAVAFAGMKDGLTDLYLLDLQSGGLRQLTTDPQDDFGPVFAPDGKSLLYTTEAEARGTPIPYRRRLYRLELSDLSVRPVLEVDGSLSDPVPSADGRRALLVLETEGLNEVAELDLESGRLRRLTRSFGAAFTPTYAPGGEIAFSALRRGSIHIYRGARERFLLEDVIAGAPSGASTTVMVSTEPVRFSFHKATSPFTTDLFLPAFFYSSNAGFFWTSYWQGSDLLGRHQAQALATYASGEGFLNYQTLYAYNRWRPQLTAGAVGLVARDLIDDGTGFGYRESSHAQFVGASYPFDRYHRLDLVTAAVTDRRTGLDTTERIVRDARIVSARLARDTVRGRYLVATRGSRLSLNYLVSPRLFGGNFVYQTFSGEGVTYVPTGGSSALVLRGVGIQSVGPATPQYILGGLGGVRGYGRSTVTDVGSRLGLATAEWRVPVWSNLDYYMWYIFPDFYFKAISLALFSDAGYAWSADEAVRRAQWRDLRVSYGLGMRIHTFVLQLFPLVLHFDYARRTTSEGDIFYFYLGPLF